ncbi:hypothetical protein G8770_18700 [Aestuariicella hydrocarbonica]|uniref:Uncharacterized protein n=1 Tax=Pseudomaricurvus hydrocarbonicus TaxID=1470433 RepID=A0A9E5MNN1_9GAMM|nr:hypothetical protein [Aestuariicella hydrocarbonica]NHO67580.1 hypothetical protein [Aestuariicella hydrocarbonica]
MMMKTAGLLIHVVSLLVAVWTLAAMSEAWSGLYLWVVAPYLPPLVFAVNAVKGHAVSWVMSVTGVVSSLLGSIAYLSVYFSPQTDAQAGLVFVAIPLYQWVFLSIALLIHFLVKRNTRR